jgi:hypothetical protein
MVDAKDVKEWRMRDGKTALSSATGINASFFSSALRLPAMLIMFGDDNAYQFGVCNIFFNSSPRYSIASALVSGC